MSQCNNTGICCKPGHKEASNLKGQKADLYCFGWQMPPRREFSTYSSDNSRVTETPVDVHYCAYCATFALIIDISLATAPRRKTDQSIVVDESKATMRRAMVAGETKLIKRAGGVERQCRLNCKNCSLPLAYRPVPIDQPTKFLYIIANALTTNPAEVSERVVPLATAAAAAASSSSAAAPADETPEQREEREYAEEERLFFAAAAEKLAAAAANAPFGTKPKPATATATATAPATTNSAAAKPKAVTTAPATASSSSAPSAAAAKPRDRSRSRSRDRTTAAGGKTASKESSRPARDRRSRSRSPAKSKH